AADFQPGKFQVRPSGGGYGGGFTPRPAAVREPQPPPYNPGPPSGPGPNGTARTQAEGGASDAPARRHLKVVEPAGDDAAPSDRTVEADTGPRRLVVRMEETTDEAADRRRIRRIFETLDEVPGDVAVEVVIEQRGGAVVRLQRGGVDAAALERLI